MHNPSKNMRTTPWQLAPDRAEEREERPRAFTKRKTPPPVPLLSDGALVTRFSSCLKKGRMRKDGGLKL